MPNDQDDAIARRFAAIAYTTHDDSDWLDVRRRARGVRPRRRRLWIAAGAAATAALFAASASALVFGNRVLGIIVGDPAPPEVRDVVSRVDQGAPPGMAPGVEAEETRQLMGIALSNGDRAVLWIAPTRSGELCTYVQRMSSEPSGGPGCGSAPVSDAPIMWTLQGPGENEDPVVLLYGRTRVEGLSRLRLTFEDGSKRDLLTNQGFFLTEIPRGHQMPGRRPSGLVAYTASGEIAATARIVAGFGVYPGSKDRP